MGKSKYDYDEARAYCEGLGLRFDEATIPMVDEKLAELGLTQREVTGVVQLHAWIIGYRFNPGTYTWRQRIALACHFLFGRSNPAFSRKETV